MMIIIIIIIIIIITIIIIMYYRSVLTGLNLPSDSHSVVTLVAHQYLIFKPKHVALKLHNNIA